LELELHLQFKFNNTKNLIMTNLFLNQCELVKK